MLICTDCHIEYESDQKYCSRCGRALVPKEAPAPQQKETKDEGLKQGGKPYCPICKITYEFGNSCINCGAPLGGQPDAQTLEAPKPVLAPEAAQNQAFVQDKEETPEPPKERFICPRCKIFYQKMQPCIRCGADLIVYQEGAEVSQEQEAEQEAEEEVKQEAKQHVKQEKPRAKPPLKQPSSAPSEKLVCPNCDLYYRGEIICQKCGSILVEQASLPGRKEAKRSPPDAAHEGREPLPSSRVRETHYPYPLSEQMSTQEQTDGTEISKEGPKRGKKPLKRLFIEIGSIGIMVIAGGYFLWLAFSYMTSRGGDLHRISQDETSRSSFSQTSTPPQASNSVGEPQDNNGTKEAMAIPAASPQGLASNSENSDSEGIKSLLENIRKANLQKDIELFMSCYASDFKDRDEKKKTTLKVWGDISYNELLYDMKKLSITGNTASAKVEWLFKFTSKSSNRYEENKRILDATFKKEGEEWKIKDTKPGK